MNELSSHVETVENPAPLDILIITQWYRPELIGVAKYSSEMAEFFASHGSRVSVLTDRPSYPEDKVFAVYRDGSHDQEILNKVEIRRLPTKVMRGGGVMVRMVTEINFLLIGLITLASGRVKRRRYVISFCPSVLAVFLGWFASLSGGRHVAMVYDIQSGLAEGLGMVRNGLLVQLIRLVERFCINRADHIIVLSDEMAAALVQIGICRPITVLPIWVDPEKVYPLPRSEGAAPTLLYNGNLGRKQGLGQLLDLAEVLKGCRPEIQILIRGGGFEEASLKRLAKSRNLTNLSFEPLLPPERLNNGLAQGDVHLVPQDPKAADFAVPSKIYNIMAAGRPFVATAKEGSTLWKLAEKTGAFHCSPPGNADYFAREVSALMDDPELRARLGKRGRAYILDHVTRDQILGTMTEILIDKRIPGGNFMADVRKKL